MASRQLSKTVEGSQELVVLSGRSAGGKAILPQGRSVSIGSAIDNDVVLFVPGGESWAADLQARGDHAVLVILDGTVTKNGAALTPGKEHIIRSREKLRVGDSEFMIASRQMEHLSTADSAGRQHNDVLPVAQNARLAQGSLRSAATRKPRSLVLPVLLLVGGFGLLSLGISSQLSSKPNDAATDSLNLTFKERFDLAEFNNLNYFPAGVGQNALVRGQVATQAERSRLEQIARQAGTQVDMEVQVDEVFKESIQDVYRVNGVAADVKGQGVGIASVATKTADTDRLNQISSMLKNDLSSLVELNVDNTVPEQQPARSTKLDPDKEIAMIVAGSDGYVVTRDTARYFVGSLMPNGYTVKSVEDGAVVVVRDNEEVILKF